MKLPIPSLVLAFLARCTLSEASPACSGNSDTPCSCPDGTTYRESVTFAVIGASGTNVKNLISHYFQTAWFGASIERTTGKDNVPGATRTAELGTLVGTYEVTEKLTAFRSDPRGSFIQKFEQLDSTVPLEYHSGNGSFSGYWITLAAKAIFQHETAIEWSVYACETGYPRNFAKFHESALANATAILGQAGKVKGENVKPFSIQAFLKTGSKV